MLILTGYDLDCSRWCVASADDSDAPDADHALMPAAEAATGWAEQGMQIDDQGMAPLDDMAAANPSLVSSSSWACIAFGGQSQTGRGAFGHDSIFSKSSLQHRLSLLQQKPASISSRVQTGSVTKLQLSRNCCKIAVMVA